MVSIRGTFRDGCAQPEDQVEGRDGQPVIITFLEEVAEAESSGVVETDYAALTQLLTECQMDTGIADLAHQHEHYLYGTPKQPPPKA